MFLSEYGSFFLTLKNLNYYQGNNQGNNQGSDQGNNQNGVDWIERKEQVLTLVQNDPSIKLDDIQELTGLTRRQLTRTIDMLKEEKRLEREGSARSGKWITHQN